MQLTYKTNIYATLWRIYNLSGLYTDFDSKQCDRGLTPRRRDVQFRRLYNQYKLLNKKSDKFSKEIIF